MDDAAEILGLCRSNRELAPQLYVPAENRYERMPYRRCGRSGLKLPAISLGLWQNFGDDRPLVNSRAILRRAFDLGITHFDLANNYGPPYGSAEINFGRIFAEDFAPYRDEIVDLDQGRLRHVGRTVRRVGLAQVRAREPRAEPRPDAARLCRHLLLPPASTPRRRSRRRWARSTRPSGRARPATSASRATVPAGPRRQPKSSASSARRCSSTSPRIRCSIAGSRRS